MEYLPEVFPYVASAVVGFIGGWYYRKYHYCRQCLTALLFILMKLHKRGTYLSPYDQAIIRVAIDCIK